MPNLKKYIKKTTLFLLCGVCSTYFVCADLQSISLASDAAILVDPCGVAGFTVLYEKNSAKQYYPASITKIATASYVLDTASELLDQPIAADKESVVSLSSAAKEKSNYSRPAYWLEPDGTHIGIKVGEILTLKDLISGTLVASGNDAANVIAHALSGTIPDFVIELNQYMKKLGCKNTHFCNPHGLHHPDHKTSAYDMAILAAHAMKNPVFRSIVTLTRYIRPKTNKQNSTVLTQTNKLLKPGKLHYSKAVGVKTGYTSKAKRTFVAAAEYEGRLLIAVCLKCEKRDGVFKDAAKLFEAAFNEEKVERVLLKKGLQKYSIQLQGAQDQLTTFLPEDVVVEYFPSENPQFKASIHWHEIALPIVKNTIVAHIDLQTKEGVAVDSIPLYAADHVSSTWAYWLQSWLY